MRKVLLILSILALLVVIPSSALAAPLPKQAPVVHSVLFWSNGCPYCTKVLTDVLPPLQEKYSSQLSILLIELISTSDIDNLYALGASLGLSKEQVSVPFMLIDHSALIGADEIQANLSNTIDQYISTGGLDYPDIPQLSDMLSRGILFTSFDPNLLLFPQPSAGNPALSAVLAWGVMAVMAIALILAIVAILRAFQGKPMGDIKGWVDLLIPVLSVIGLGVSIYLSYVEVTHTQALCGPVGDCNAVQSSPYAKLFGVLPIGIAGAIGYIAILVVWLWRRYRRDNLSRIAGPGMFGMALFGTLFSVYLTYLEIFVIHAVCIWCLSSAVIIAAIMLLNLPSITQWLAISDDEEEPGA